MRRLIFGGVLLAACGLSGCFLNRAGNGTDPDTDGGATDSGAPRLDSGRVDAGPRDAAAPRIDAGPRDGGRDAGPRDAGPPDAGAVDSGLPTPTCDDVYGAAPGYVNCGVTLPGLCEFYTEHASSTDSCQSVCMALTGNPTCRRRYRDGVPVCMHRDSAARECETTGNSSDICVCTL